MTICGVRKLDDRIHVNLNHIRTFEITTVNRNFTQNYIHFNNPKPDDRHELRKPTTAFTSTTLNLMTAMN